MKRQPVVCPECGKAMRQTAGLLCTVCVRNEDVRKRYGILTAADFSLQGLELRERMLLFLYAAGQDISAHLRGPDHTPRGDHPDLDALKQGFTIHHGKLGPLWSSRPSTPDTGATQPQR